MNGIWKYFSLAHTLFFAIPFPMLIYYNDPAHGIGTEESGPWMAFIYVLLSITLWLLVLWRIFSRWVLAPFREKKILEQLLHTGARVEGLVLESEIRHRRSNGAVVQHILFSLNNFSNEPIKEALEFVDSRPHERRFEPGKKVMLRIDEQMKRLPAVTLEDARPKLRKGWIFLYTLGCLVITATVMGYCVFSYQLQSNGAGWRFMVFYHPLLLCPLILLGIWWSSGKLMELFISTPKNVLELKYYGRRTDADVILVSETGTYINDQPKIRFDLRYTDHLGRTHSATLKRVVPLLELKMAQAKTLPVFYLTAKPGEVMLAEDVDG